MAFKQMDGVYSNEDMSVEYELADPISPIMVESDGWMSLEDAKLMRDDLSGAIDAVAEHLANNPVQILGRAPVVTSSGDGS